MAEGIKGKLGETVERAKDKVSPSGPPVATDAEGRVQVVREALQAFGRGDADAFLGAMREDVDWEAPAGDNFPGGGALEGHDEIRSKFLEDSRRTFQSFGFRPETYLESEDRDQVVVIGTYSGEGKQGGAFETAGVQIWDFDRGQVVRVQSITDTAVMPAVVTEEEERKRQEEQEKQEKRERMEEKGEAEDVDEHGEEDEDAAGGEEDSDAGAKDEDADSGAKDEDADAGAKDEDAGESAKEQDAGGDGGESGSGDGDGAARRSTGETSERQRE